MKVDVPDSGKEDKTGDHRTDHGSGLTDEIDMRLIKELMPSSGSSVFISSSRKCHLLVLMV